MLRLFMVAVLVLVLPAISASVFMEKKKDCKEINAEFNTCSIQAYEDYKKAFEAGDDGRPDWMARNYCNYMTDAVKECGNKLIGDCNMGEDVTNKQADERFVSIGQLKTSIEEWDSEKCPLVQSYIKRIKRQVEDGEEEGSVAEDVEEAEGEDGADAVDKDAGVETESKGGVDAEKEDAGDVAEGEGGEDTETKEGEDLGGDTEAEEVEEAEGKDGVVAGDDAVDKDAGDETETEGGVDAEKEEDAGDVVDGEGGEDTETEDLGGDTKVDIAGGDDDDTGDDEEGYKVDEEEDKKNKEESSAASISASLSLLVAFYLAL